MPRTFGNRLRGFDRRLWVLVAGWVISAVGFSMVFPFLAIYLREIRDFPSFHVALVFPAMGLAGVAGVLLSGQLVDWMGRRIIMIGAPAARGVLVLYLAWQIHLDAGIVTIAGLLCVSSFLGSFFQVAADTYVSDLVEPDRRADAYALLRVGLNAGWMTGPAIGAFLARTPFSLLFAVMGVSAFVLAGLAWFFCHETLEISSGGGERERVSPAVVLGHPSFLLFSGLVMMLFLGSSQLVSTLSVYSTGVIGIAAWQLGFAYTLNGLLNVVFQIPVNAVFSGESLRWRISTGALLYALGYLLLGIASDYGGVILTVVVISFAEMLVMPSSIAITTRFAPPEAKGRFVGFYGLTRRLGFSFGPFIGLTLLGHFRAVGVPRLVWMVLPLSTIVAGLGLGIIRHAAMTGRAGEPDGAKAG